MYSPGIESTHVMVALHSSIHDGSISLLSDALPGNLVVNPLGVTPHGIVDLAELHGGACVVLDGLLEFVVEVTVVQEHVGVVEPPVEVTLDRFQGLHHTVNLLVPGKDNKGRVSAGGIHFLLNGTASGREDLVVFLTDFPERIRKVSKAHASGSQTHETNLIEGGVPAGIRMPPGDEGCRTKRSRTRTITMHGNSKTKPRGMEMDELPFKRIRRRKKANLERLRPFSREESSRGRLGEEGSHFEIRCFRPMGAEWPRCVDSRWTRQSTAIKIQSTQTEFPKNQTYFDRGPRESEMSSVKNHSSHASHNKARLLSGCPPPNRSAI